MPPIIAIVLALLTKEVISSLLIGILSGTLIYTHFDVVKTIDVTFGIMSDKLGGNASIILFLALLGALVCVITKAGGSAAYGDWAVKKLKTRAGAQFATGVLGALIFIDDYFNCLTVGTVMRPVTDKHHVSRAKLAYIIDATAAPVCIIAPISSWAVAVGSTMESSGVADGMATFIQTIPFNLYAFLTIIMVVFICWTNLDYGPMAKFEHNAVFKNDLHSNPDHPEDIEESGTQSAKKGKVYDLIIPIVALIVFSILAMLYVGGLFTGEASSIGEAFGNTDASKSLCMGGLGALVVAFILFLPRKILGFRDFMDGITEGVKSMVPAFIILTLAWTISGVCSADYLNTGGFVGHLVETSNMPLQILPAVVFVVASLLAFATGTSWGTFGILIPIVVPIIGATGSNLLIPALAATLAGAVYGDHISPISDTTILSSTGARCNHIDHVTTQIPYATTVSAVCFVGFLIAGFTNNVYITLAASIVMMLAVLVVLKLIQKKKEAVNA
ncbi:Na+/H+ antiporter NhaC family protein [Zongyangia hominis]|uniref:Na+/H+ antiporter NhaC family protein n=1 Tax=Zongyangia hominis TaxID=2763677 RepID=UPI0037098612